MKVAVHEVSKHYVSRRGRVDALAQMNMSVGQGEFVSLVGPSGCGKSTLLHVIGGLEPPSTGRVEVGGDVVRGPGAELGIVFQRQTLFPWLTVWDNVWFPYRLKRNRSSDRADSEAREARVVNLLNLVGLLDFRTSRPAELSGGMQQRVAIARALVAQPDALLMDEPFGALDAQTREEMQELLLHLNGFYRTTTLFVTHDVEEALLLSDRVLVFSGRPGRIISELTVPFDRDRRNADLKLEPEFVALKRSILADLRQVPLPRTTRSSLLHDLTNQER